MDEKNLTTSARVAVSDTQRALGSDLNTYAEGCGPESFREVVEGVELHWTARGTGSTVLVLHGLSDSERTWWPVMDELGKRHRVLGLDLPGCGLSGRPDASYRLDWEARLVAAWLDRIGPALCERMSNATWCHRR